MNFQVAIVVTTILIGILFLLRAISAKILIWQHAADVPRQAPDQTWLRRMAAWVGLLAAGYAAYFSLIHYFAIGPLGRVYLALPIFAIATIPSAMLFDAMAKSQGKAMPPAFAHPWLSVSLAEFWSRRWNLWTSRMLNQLAALFTNNWRDRVLLAFFISGVGHDLIITVPFWAIHGVNTVGTMTLFFAIHGYGVLFDRAYLTNRPFARRAFFWLLMLATAPLFFMEGTLRMLLLW